MLPAAGDPDVLLLGDFNSYPQETPVTTLTGGGFTDLETALLGPNAYSYLFDGQIGHLDYAFASGSLTPQVAGVAPWHINADEVPLFDYNDEVFDSPGEANFEEKPDGSSLVPPRLIGTPARWRAPPPRPVITDCSPSPTCRSQTGAPDPCCGRPTSLTLYLTNNGPNPAVNASWTDNLPSPLTFVSLSPVAGWSCISPPVGVNGNVTCTNPSFAVGSAVFTLVANVPLATPPSVIMNTASVQSVADSNTTNNSATAATTSPVELIESRSSNAAGAHHSYGAAAGIICPPPAGVCSSGRA